MGEPYFKIAQAFERQGGVACSSNFALYADMSNRVMTILGGFSPRQEVYSVDECFLDMAGQNGLTNIGHSIRTKVLAWTGLPVCVGFAPTKTLAKLANQIAKKRPEWKGVCELSALSPAAQDTLVGGLEVGEVWGVGPRIAAQLQQLGIHTVRQLRDADPTTIRARFSVVLERTVLELRGIPCIELEDAPAPRQQLMVSRSFGLPVTQKEDLGRALAHFTARAAEKLRAQDCVAGNLSLFIRTSPFRAKEPQYSQSLTAPLQPPTANTLSLTQVALQGLERIYREGFSYAKAGVLLMGLMPQEQAPSDLFEAGPVSPKGQALMATLDKVNARFGRSALTTAVAQGTGLWSPRRDRTSPAYTTRWSDLIRVRG